MFKGNNKYIWIFIIMFVLIVMVQYALPKPVNWQRTFASKDKNPMGTYALHQLMTPTYGKNLTINRSTIYNLGYSFKNEHKCLILINNEIKLNKTDLKTLFQFVSDGNNALIAAADFSGAMADTFHLNTRQKFFDYIESHDSLVKKIGIRVKMTAKNLVKKEYPYSMQCRDHYFTNYDSSKFSCRSTNQDSSAVIIEANIGKGKLILMSVPDVFANYFIVKQPNRMYAYTALSLATENTKDIIWDEYYKTFNEHSESFLKLIFDSDALYTAYLLMLLTLIVYMISDGRRRQRAIPELEPVKNTTLEFVNVVSHVYFNSENHKYIADERVKYFYETIRKRFNVPTSEINDLFIETLGELSGYDDKLLRQLFMYCERLRKMEEATEYDLIELNRQIANFNNKSLR